MPDDHDPTIDLPADQPPGDGDRLPEQRLAGAIPKRIGKFVIKSLVASGGMGSVYKAVQEQPHRTVALKLMKSGIASRSALRRFEYEAQLLARLRHPSIAEVYDAGTHETADGGTPYFAMEYIPGARRITDYAREKKLSTKERLELFLDVCDAVHHGHTKGVIHRDLKPDNILADSHGRVKIIDFGVARATDSDMVAATLQTDVGQLVGTLQYMSPEQVEADPDDLDTRSDVYSLGVILYELLSEQLPYDVTQMRLYEATRVIREREVLRLSTINASLKGDVETIVLKALERDRDRRYQTAQAIAEDIRRYLNLEPINARPPSVTYQLRTFARRNRAVVSGVAAVFVALLAGVISSTVWWLDAARERDRARGAEQRAGAEAEKSREAEKEAREAELENRRLLYVADLNLAFGALQEGRLERVERLLERHRSDGTGKGPSYAWSLLSRMLRHYLPLRLYDHGAPVAHAAVCLHEDLLATAGTDEVVLWDVRTGNQISRLAKTGVVSLCFAPDGKQLAIASGSREAVTLWDTESLRERQLAGAQAIGLTYSHLGDRLALLTEHEVQTYDIDTERVRPMRNLPPGQRIPLSDLRFSSDDARLAWAEYGVIHVLDCETLDVMQLKHPRFHHKWIFSLSFANRHPWLAVGRSRDPHQVEIWDIETKTLVKELQGHTLHITALAFAADDETFVSADERGVVHRWDTRTWTLARTLQGHGSVINGVALSRDGESMMTAGGDDFVKLWPLSRGTLPHSMQRSPSYISIESSVSSAEGLVTTLDFSKTGGAAQCRTVALSDARKTVTVDFEFPYAASQLIERLVAKEPEGDQLCVWNTRTGQKVRTFPRPSRFNGLAMSRDGRLAAAFGKEEVTLFNVNSGDVEDAVVTAAEGVFFRGSEELIVARRQDVQVWSVSPLELKRAFPARVSRAELSPDGQYLYSVTPEEPGGPDLPRSSQCHEIDTGREVFRTEPFRHSRSRAVCFLQDRQLLAAGDGNEIVLFDLVQGKQRNVLRGHHHSIATLAYANDGRTLASGGFDGVIKLWDIDTGQELMTLFEDQGAIFTITFGTDGAMFATNDDNTLWIWP